VWAVPEARDAAEATQVAGVHRQAMHQRGGRDQRGREPDAGLGAQPTGLLGHLPVHRVIDHRAQQSVPQGMLPLVTGTGAQLLRVITENPTRDRRPGNRARPDR